MSGCTVRASRLVGEAVGGTLAKTCTFFHRALFESLGMTTVRDLG
jgi:hypothetical protein